MNKGISKGQGPEIRDGYGRKDRWVDGDWAADRGYLESTGTATGWRGFTLPQKQACTTYRPEASCRVVGASDVTASCVSAGVSDHAETYRRTTDVARGPDRIFGFALRPAWNQVSRSRHGTSVRVLSRPRAGLTELRVHGVAGRRRQYVFRLVLRQGVGGR